MEEASLQKLNEVTVEQGVAELPHVPCPAIAELLPYSQVLTRSQAASWRQTTFSVHTA